LQVSWKGFGELVFSNADRLVDVAQGIFRHHRSAILQMGQGLASGKQHRELAIEKQRKNPMELLVNSINIEEHLADPVKLTRAKPVNRVSAQRSGPRFAPNGRVDLNA
jgi:hypothetical protein